MESPDDFSRLLRVVLSLCARSRIIPVHMHVQTVFWRLSRTAEVFLVPLATTKFYSTILKVIEGYCITLSLPKRDLSKSLILRQRTVVALLDFRASECHPYTSYIEQADMSRGGGQRNLRDPWLFFPSQSVNRSRLALSIAPPTISCPVFVKGPIEIHPAPLC